MRRFIQCKSAFAASLAALIAVVSVTDTGSLVLGGGPAEAVIGRPLTPGSYAGVARRTTRRSVRRHAYYGGGYGGAYAAPVVSSAAVVTTLPSACGQVAAPDGVYYECSGTRYAPAYSGGTVVYHRY